MTLEGSTSNGENEQKIPLMSAHEIRLMDTEDIIGFRAGLGLHPFRAKRFDWRDFPELTMRANIAPPDVHVLPPYEERMPPIAPPTIEPLSSWHFSLNLFRQKSLSQGTNGFQKQTPRP